MTGLKLTHLNIKNTIYKLFLYDAELYLYKRRLEILINTPRRGQELKCKEIIEIQKYYSRNITEKSEDDLKSSLNTKNKMHSTKKSFIIFIRDFLKILKRKASDFQENLEEMFPSYYMHSDVSNVKIATYNTI